jgi:hypothetical protein
MILGDDLLTEHSPMWMHWRHRIIKFTHKGRRIPISNHKLQGLLRRGAISHLVQVQPPRQTAAKATLHTLDSLPNGTPVQVQQLLQQFQSVFQELSE